MDNGIYVSLSRQLGLFRQMEVISNNIANVNTTGYQSSHLTFESYLSKDSKNGPVAYANDVSTYRSTAPGTLQATGNTLDVAIRGNGYFMVETPLGERYTRAGNFQIDGAGNLVTVEGYPVLDQNRQPIFFNSEDKVITIGTAGNIATDGDERAILGVVSFENPQMMKQVGERLFSSEIDPDPATDFSVEQGVLENSNVNAVTELTHLIDVSRAVGNNAKFVETMYDLERKTYSSWTQQS